MGWHENFNPRRFLNRIDVEKLISKNQAFPDNEVPQLLSPCLLCKNPSGAGIILNDKRFICRGCFRVVSLIEYPEKYEALRREYLIKCEARRNARAALIEGNVARRISGLFASVATISLLLVFWKIPLILFSFICFGISALAKKAYEEELRKWEKEYPEPHQPVLRHFHDPNAALTSRDELILEVFNHWPGYPPFWNYLREIVLKRDGYRCQVTGCPSRLELHIHHRKPVSKDGPHSPENLIALCDFHHALEPDAGHERIWATIRTRYFTLVREHTRSKRSTSGTHEVSAHLRRLELITAAELNSLSKTYGFCCPHCGSGEIQMYVDEKRNIVQVE